MKMTHVAAIILFLGISITNLSAQTRPHNGMVQIPILDGKPDPKFVLPNGLTLQESRDVQSELQSEFSASEEIRRIRQQVNELMDKAEALAAASVAQRRPDLKEKIFQYIAYSRNQRSSSQSKNDLSSAKSN